MAAVGTGRDRGDRRSHALRIAGGALFAVVAAWILAWIAATRIVDEGFVERRLADAASRHFGPHRATVGEVSVLPLRFGLSVGSLRLEPEAGHRGGGIELQVSEAALTGIRPWSLLGGPLEAGQLTVTRLRIDRYRGASPDGRRTLELEGVHVDRDAGRAEIGRAHLLTVTREVVSRPESEGGPLALDDTTAVRAGPIVLEGLRASGSAPGASATARSLLVDSLDVEAVEGITGNPRPGPPEPSATPVQQLRSLGLHLRIDSATVRNGSVLYRERRVGSARSGEIRFEALEGTVRPLPLGEAPTADGDTVTATARARVNGRAPVWLSLRFPPDAEGLTFAADAGVADLEVATLNSILLPIEGVEVQGGRLDSLTFSVRVDRGRARGRAVPYYRGLSLSIEDPSTGTKGVMEWAKGLLVDLKLNEDNLPAEGEGFRSATIDLRAEPGTTLWEYLWDCVSQGLKSVTGT